LARLEAEGYKVRLGMTELELAKQLDSLRELQWRLDSVASQLGYQQQHNKQQQQQQHERAPDQGWGRRGGAAAYDGVDLLSKVVSLSRAACCHCCRPQRII
jgi:hypothetical protein